MSMTNFRELGLPTVNDDALNLLVVRNVWVFNHKTSK